MFLSSGCVMYRIDGCKLTFVKPDYLDRNRVVSKYDIKILERAMAIFNSEEKWNYKGDRLCFYERWSLFCSLAKASIDVVGRYKHRRVIMQEIRFTIDGHFPTRWRHHRMQDFNNHKETTFKDIMMVFNMTKSRLDNRFFGQK